MEKIKGKKAYYLRLSKIVRLLIVLSLLFQNRQSRAQDSTHPELNGLINSIKTFNETRAIERLYLHLDKPEYLSEDTIWFKAYLFNAILLKNSSKSSLMYIEIATDSNRVVNRIMIPLISGISWGNIVLGKKEFPEGLYTLRAYTSWMKNFDEKQMFVQHFRISSPQQQSWLINSNFNLSKQSGKDQLNLSMQFSDMNGAPMGLRPIQFRLTDGKRSIIKTVKESSLYGKQELNIELPEKLQNSKLSLIAKNQGKGEISKEMLIPIIIQRPEHTDLQFMPEGGHLVSGHLTNIAFKAIAEDGKGTDISGIIVDSKYKEITSFSSAFRGMGRFRFIPLHGESYSARIKLPDGQTKDYPLPSTKNTGTTLKVINRRESDSLEVLILSSPDSPFNQKQFYLTGQTNGIPYYGAVFLLKAGMNRILIDKNLFPTGVCRISLLNDMYYPVNGRLVFIDHQDNLKIQISTDKAFYTPRDSLSLSLLVHDSNGRPVQGNFSLSVTDDNRVKRDIIKENNILSKLLLDSDLKGTIESPGYYFLSDQKEKAWLDLDNLLLTQGWTGFNWPEVLNQQIPLIHPAENEFQINGTISNIFNKPISNSEVILFSKKPFLLMDTLSNKEGRFTFRDVPLTDTAVYVIQSRNKKGKSFNIGIGVDEFIPPVFEPSKEPYIPWYISNDTLAFKSNVNSMKEQAHWTELLGKNMLEEIVVTATKFIKESRNRNGAGNADYILNEEDMQKAKKKTLYELLGERYPGFRTGVGMAVKDANSDTTRYILMNSIVNLIIDGVNIKTIGASEEMYMDYLTAEDITGIEILKTPKYAFAYDRRIVEKIRGCRACPPPPIFLEVTTRSGNGAFLKKTPGVYLYKPIPFSFPAEFYRPKYPLNKLEGLPDLRSTIHWEPNIITDKEGKASVSFYSSDLPGQYSIIVEGTDMNGSIGFLRRTIEIKK